MLIPAESKGAKMTLKTLMTLYDDIDDNNEICIGTYAIVPQEIDFSMAAVP